MCAGEGAAATANIRNAPVDKSNIATTPAKSGAAPTNGKEGNLGKERPRPRYRGDKQERRGGWVFLSHVG